MESVKRYFWVSDGMAEGGKARDSYVSGADFDRLSAWRDADQKKITDLQNEATAYRNEAEHGRLAFDQVTAENLALQQRLTVQDQREDDLKGLVRELVEYADQLLLQVNDAWSYAGSTGAPQTHKDADYLRALELLNPSAEAESHE